MSGRDKSEETPREAADRAELAEFLKTHPADRMNLRPEMAKFRIKERATMHLEVRFDLAAIAFSVYLLYLGVSTLPRITYGQLIAILAGSVILGVKVHKLVQWLRQN